VIHPILTDSGNVLAAGDNGIMPHKRKKPLSEPTSPQTRASIEQWQSRTCEERFAAMWQMVVSRYAKRGIPESALKMDRSAERLLYLGTGRPVRRRRRNNG